MRKWKLFGKDQIWFQILAAITVIFLLVVFYSYINNRFQKDGFTNITLEESYTLKQNQDVFDDFYIDIMDQIIPQNVYEEEVETIIRNTQSTPEKSVILDIGSQKGQLLMEFKRRGYKNVYGIDKHKAMVNQTDNEVAENVVCADPLNKLNFDRGIFSHILCLHQTLYEISDLSPFFENVRFWLKPGGVLVLHLVHYDDKIPKFTMELPSQIRYVRNVEIQNSAVLKITETFVDKVTNHVRQQEQHLNYKNEDRVLKTASYFGFAMQGKMEIKSNIVPNGTREFIYFLTIGNQ